MTSMKKFYLFALTALSAVHALAFDFESDGIYYTLTGSKTVCVDKGTYDYDSEDDITIPATVTNGGKTYTVTAIADNAFKASKVTSVTLPEGLTTIGNSAFQGSTLKSVTLPSTLNNMGTGAFRDCKSLTNITLPDALKEVKEYAFNGCGNLKTLTLGSKTEVIEQHAFENTGIIIVNIPKSVKTINNNAFANNSAMKTLVIDDAAVFLDYYAFYKCTNLSSVDLGNAVTGFGVSYRSSKHTASDTQGTFNECTSLTGIVIPSSVTEIVGTFKNCTRLTDVTLPNTLTQIGIAAFYKCAMREVNIPSSVVNIDTEAFGYCPLASVSLPSSLKTIGNYAFSQTSLTEVTIPSSVISIGSFAFSECGRLQKVRINNAATTITGSFYKCTALSGVDLGNAVVALYQGYNYGDYGCFEGCTSLTSIRLSNTIKTVSPCTFRGCNRLEEVILPNACIEIENNAFEGCSLLKTISLPNTIQTIGDNAFKDCGQLQSVAMPTSLYAIGKNAFTNCIALKELFVPEHVTSMDTYAFSGCTGLKSVVFDNPSLAISEGVFDGCKGLQSVELGKYIINIGHYSFRNCTSLECVVIPDKVETLGYAFQGCTALKSAVIGKGVKEIKEYYYNDKSTNGLFSGCTKLSSVEIKSTILTIIKGQPFYNCRSLKTIELPASVTTIMEKAFEGCSALTHIYMNPLTPPSITGNTFSDYATPTLHVPADAKTAYTKADNWKNFAKVVAIGSEPKASAEEIAALEALLTQAKALYNNAVEGTEPGNFRPGAKATFKVVINEVEELISNTMLAEDVEDCTEMLNMAMHSFRNKQVKNDVQTNNTLSFAGSLKAAVGMEFRLPIEMDNTDAITGVQFDLYLPDGMTLSEDEYGDYNIELSDRTTVRRHSVASRVMGDGALRVVVSSQQNATFEGNSGTLLTLVLFPKSTIESGDHDVTLKNIILTDPQATRYAAPDMKSTISVSNYTMGDVNNDGHIDVADLAGVVRFILENADASLVFNAADMDGNGVIEINDYAALVNVILNQSTTTKMLLRRNRAVLREVIRLNNTDEGELTISLPVNDMRYTGMQFDLRLPEGIELADDGVEVISGRHSAWMQRRANGTCRIVCASMMNDEFNEGEVLRLRIKATTMAGEGTEAVCENVVLSDVDAVRHEAASAVAGMNTGEETGIRSVTTNGEAISVYDLQGRRVVLPRQGLYIVKGKKTIIK